MTLPLLRIPDHDIQFNFDQIAKQFLDTGGRAIKFRFGVTTVTFTASKASAFVSVNHGLGSAPVAVFVSPSATETGGASSVWASTNKPSAWTTTQFQCGGNSDTSLTDTLKVSWLAIG